MTRRRRVARFAALDDFVRDALEAAAPSRAPHAHLVGTIVSVAQAVVLFLAAGAAGAVNSIAGGGTLISFPALLWTGLDPIVANATNSVSLTPGALASAVGFRRELVGTRRWIAVLTPPSILGGAIGALLLLRTPSRTFAGLVPFLILGATALFALQEGIVAWLRRRGGAPADAATRGPRHLVLAATFQLAVAIYGGYFGAGIGIMMLAALGFLGFTDIHQMSGIRNLCGFWINAVAAVLFVAAGTVHWPAALVTSAGQIAGGYGGAVAARWVGQRTVRRAVVVIGVAIAASFLLPR